MCGPSRGQCHAGAPRLPPPPGPRCFRHKPTRPRLKAASSRTCGAHFQRAVVHDERDGVRGAAGHLDGPLAPAVVRLASLELNLAWRPAVHQVARPQLSVVIAPKRLQRAADRQRHAVVAARGDGRHPVRARQRVVSMFRICLGACWVRGRDEGQRPAGNWPENGRGQHDATKQQQQEA